MEYEMFFIAIAIGMMINLPIGQNAFFILSVAQVNWRQAEKLVIACVIADIFWSYLAVVLAVSPEVQLVVTKNSGILFKYVGVLLIAVGMYLYRAPDKDIKEISFYRMLAIAMLNVGILITSGSLVYSFIPQDYLFRFNHKATVVGGIATGGALMWSFVIWLINKWGKNLRLDKIKKRYAIVIMVLGVSWLLKVAAES